MEKKKGLILPREISLRGLRKGTMIRKVLVFCDGRSLCVSVEPYIERLFRYIDNNIKRVVIIIFLIDFIKTKLNRI